MVLSRRTILLLAIMAAGCTTTRARVPSGATSAFVVRGIDLPAAPDEGVFMDYLAYDPTHSRVWVPAGNTGCVEVLNVRDDSVERIGGFATAEVERHGTKRTIGPSSATAGDGVVYVGNRGDASVCAVDAGTLRLGACLTLASPPDGLAYIQSAREVWATTPRDHAIVVIDTTGGRLQWKANIPLDGQPEGFAVDGTRGIFYTNLEDKDRTLAIDIKRRQVVATWLTGCGADGPRGLVVDEGFNLLVVACSERVRVLDAGHDGRQLSALDTGAGLDNLDYVQSRHELYAAAARAGTLTIAHLDSQGALTPQAVVATVPGARNAVATGDGRAYLTDSSEGRILVVEPAR